MVSIMISMEDSLRERLNLFSWINWSEVAREEAHKREIFKEYMKSKTVSSKNLKFCEKADWHPVDELPLKKEFVEKLKEIDKRGPGKSITIKEFNNWCNSL